MSAVSHAVQLHMVPVMLELLPSDDACCSVRSTVVCHHGKQSHWLNSLLFHPLLLLSIVVGMLKCHCLTPDCCLYSISLGLLLGTEAPVMMPNGVDFSFCHCRAG